MSALTDSFQALTALYQQQTGKAYTPPSRTVYLPSKPLEQLAILCLPNDCIIPAFSEICTCSSQISTPDLIMVSSECLYCAKSLLKRFPNVPSVYWDISDSIPPQEQLPQMHLFTLVCTTDLDRIKYYKTMLPSSELHLLPYAAQKSDFKKSSAQPLLSLPQSQTAVDRRLFSMLAQSKPPLLPYSRAVKTLFGDLPYNPASAKELHRLLESTHLFSCRLQTILQYLRKEQPTGALGDLYRFADRIQPDVVPPYYPYDTGGIFTRTDTLLITDNYPSEKALYKNAFVHRRAKLYQQNGHPVDVFSFQPNQDFVYREWEGVEVIQGGWEQLDSILKTNPITTVLVHFLSAEIWEVLENYPHVRILLWFHGSDVLPWHRKAFRYTTKSEIAFAKQESAAREAFWTGIFALAAEQKRDLSFVFVSDFLANTVCEDYQLDRSKLKIAVIANCVDTTMFAYRKKTAEQRLNVLSIRSYANNNYANDLSVKAILLLSKEPCFQYFSFRLIGDGELFQKTVRPLKHFKNVCIERKFLSQPQIAALQKEYGVCLIPTRYDTQGVSRDEAMSSGMVAITTDTAAVRDFCDSDSAFLTPPEDAQALADAMQTLYQQPQLFLKMSDTAQKRIRNTLAPTITIRQELDLIQERKTV